MTVVERQPAVAGQQHEQKKVWEPKTFAEKTTFIRDVNKAHLEGRISWDDLWAYEQNYGYGAPGEKTS